MSSSCCSSSVVIIGSGAYGTALAVMLSKAGRRVLLWGHNSFHIDNLKITRCNPLLPEVFLPDSLLIETSLEVSLLFARDIIIAVPSHVFADVLIQLKPFLKFDSRIILATKGLEIGTGRLLQHVVQEILGKDIPLAIISGPTFAREIAIGLPTIIVLVATSPIFVNDVKKLLQCNDNFIVHVHSDFIGIQISSVVKNVIAIGVGIFDGVGFGANARVALITYGLIEMTRLGVAMGGQKSFFTGIAGVGDLILTCTDNQSRNRRFGILLGQGINILNAIKQIGLVVEGLNNIQEVYFLSNKYKVKMPIVEQVYQIIHHGKDVREAALYLVSSSKQN